VPAVFELGTITDSRDNRRRGLWTHTLDLVDPLPSFVRAEHTFDALIERRDPPTETEEQAIQLTDHLASPRCPLIVSITEVLRDQPTDAGDDLGECEPSLHEQLADLTDHSRSMIDHALAGSVTRVDLRAANLFECNLQGAILRGATLMGANLLGADLTGADITGARLEGADVPNAKLDGLELDTLAEARVVGCRGWTSFPRTSARS
jgi:hypothetical protein